MRRSAAHRDQWADRDQIAILNASRRAATTSLNAPRKVLPDITIHRTLETVRVDELSCTLVVAPNVGGGVYLVSDTIA